MWLRFGLALALSLGALQLHGGGAAAEDARQTRAGTARIPARGAAHTLDIASWNLAWFGATGNGPRDEALQREHIRAVIAAADMDIWGVVEVVSPSAFAALIAQLPGYAGLLANDASVLDGTAYYGDFRNAEQKPGLVYKRGLASVRDARVVLTHSERDFAGRPPLQVRLRVTQAGHSEDLVVIVVHAKCCSDARSFERRRRAASALKAYLDTTFPTQKVWVIGDFNDDLDTSISAPSASPYAAFLADTARYSFPSVALTRARSASTTGYPDTIDHHLVTDEAAATYLAGSAEVLRVDRYIANYAETTSDHFPVLSRYTWGVGATATARARARPRLSLNEIGANEPGQHTEAEFIEVVNVGDTDADLSGFTLSDAERVRHSFAPGTILPAGQAISVFGGSGALPSTGRAVAASTGELSLGNRGDTVSLRDAAGALLQSYTYNAELADTDGVSINRGRDGAVDAEFVKHNQLSTRPSSAGTRVDGSRW